MTSSQRNYILFTIFLLFALIFLFPDFSFADSVSWPTECGETITIGSYTNVYCSSCCVPSSCCTTDKKGNCISSSCCYTVSCCPCCNQYSCSGGWDEYRVETSGCGTKILKRTCQSVCGPTSNCCSCGTCKAECTIPIEIEKCENWQESKRGCEVTKWGLNKPQCQCAGRCLEAPKNPRYYDNPNYSDQPDKSKDPNNIFLPVKLDWDEVPYWKASPDGPQSYKITIENTAEGTFSKTLTESEYNPQKDKGSCFLKSNTTHNWQVKACCGADGTNCQEDPAKQLREAFTTNFAPEPISPIDPDWNGDLITENVSAIATSVVLDWCEVENAQSYRAQFYLIKNGEEICHPPWKMNGECGSFSVTRKKRPPPYPSEEKLPSEFIDDRGIFTKETEYRWRLASCSREEGWDCGDFGQKWGFNTKSEILPKLELISPPNDPRGEKQVGFPVILEWEHKPGSNSFKYEIDSLAGTTTGAQAAFNYPQLSLDKIYSWRIKPCWDYKANDCENFWSDVWTFKTTGAPPKLIYPSGNNIPIPIKFDWEDVSGAGSYVYEIYKKGGELVKTEVASISDVSINYPPLTQETSYSWQVKTCADKKGGGCGAWSGLQDFTTFKLSQPKLLSPENGKEVSFTQGQTKFSWESTPYANYYKYVLTLVSKSSEETSGECIAGNKEEEIVPTNSVLLPLKCLGDYKWLVTSCLDSKCEQSGNPSNELRFTLSQKAGESQKGGLVPCGRNYDNPDTPWNERKSCQITHIFILLHSILSFILWKLAPLMLVVLALITGVIFYFAMGETGAIIQVRSLWKAAGVGYGLIFLGWMIIDIFLKISGYQVGIFGAWWQFKF